MAEERDFVELVSVVKRFGKTAAVSDCTLSVTRGDFVTLLGPSGCGKTTTLRLIAGFLRPDSGELRVAGEVMSSGGLHVPPERRNMGMVFQSFAVWPHMKVFENVSLPLRIRGVGRSEINDRCAEILKLCRLDGLEGRHPHQLSGGQLQRVALARSLVYRPHVLLLDEPLSNLDASLREEMRRELKGIHQAIGTTFVFVTHDQVEAMSLSDRVVVMREGRIEQIGSPREIYVDPKTDFVAEFVGAANILKCKVRGPSEEEDPPSYRVQIDGMELVARPPRDPQVDTACTVVVHPESIRIVSSDQPVSDENRFEGRIRDFYFLGRIQEIVVEIGSIDFRAVQVRGESFKRGETVQVVIPPSGVILL